MPGTVTEYLTTGEAADLLGCHRDTVKRYLREGKLTAVRPGGDGGWQRIRRSDVLALLSPQGDAE